MLILHPYPYKHHSELRKLRKQRKDVFIKSFPAHKVYMRMSGCKYPLFQWSPTSKGPAIEVVDYEEITGRKVPEKFGDCPYLAERMLMNHSSLLSVLKQHKLTQLYNRYYYDQTLREIVIRMLNSSQASLTLPNPPKGIADAARHRYGDEISIRTENGTMRLERMRTI